MRLKLKWKVTIFIIIFILFMYFLMSYVCNLGIHVREYKVVNNNIPIYGFKVIQFSDLYYNNDIDRLNNIVNLINKTKPDIVIFSGDLVSDKITFNSAYQDLTVLKNITSTYGKYYVKGEMDNSDLFDALMEECGFEALNNSYDIIDSVNGKILITGIDIDNELDLSVLDNESSYKILVSHYPDSTINYINNFDLVLSSHSLNGQVRLPVFKGIFKFENALIYNEPYYKINNTDMYITGGIGNKVLNIRLFNTPSFNLYRIVKES